MTWEHLGPVFGRPAAILELSYTGKRVNLIMLFLCFMVFLGFIVDVLVKMEGTIFESICVLRVKKLVGLPDGDSHQVQRRMFLG